MEKHGITKEDTARVERLLEKLDLPYHAIRVFGSIYLNIHVDTRGRTTAERWQQTLRGFCSRVRIVETIRYNKENRGTVLKPSRFPIFRVCAVV